MNYTLLLKGSTMVILVNGVIGLGVGLLIAFLVARLDAKDAAKKSLQNDSMLSKSLMHASIRAGSICLFAGLVTGVIGWPWWSAIAGALLVFVVVAILIGLSTRKPRR